MFNYKSKFWNKKKNLQNSEKQKKGRLTTDFSYTRHLDKEELKKLEAIRQKGFFPKGVKKGVKPHCNFEQDNNTDFKRGVLSIHNIEVGKMKYETILRA